MPVERLAKTHVNTTDIVRLNMLVAVYLNALWKVPFEVEQSSFAIELIFLRDDRRSERCDRLFFTCRRPHAIVRILWANIPFVAAQCNGDETWGNFHIL